MCLLENASIGFLTRFCQDKNMKYIIAIKKTKYGYDTHVPALPGCHSQGNTEREAIANTRDAVLTYLDME